MSDDDQLGRFLLRSSLAMAAAAALGACIGTSAERQPLQLTAPGGMTPSLPGPRTPGSELFVFGGAVATCQAESCTQPDLIYLRQAAAPWSPPEMSGFEPAGARNGVPLAHRQGQSQGPFGTTSYRHLGAWTEYTAFRFEVAVDRAVFAGPSSELRYELVSSGDATGADPPLSGPATWSGAMAGFVIPRGSETDGDFVAGDAEIRLAPGPATSLDVAFDNIVNRRTGDALRDMVWTGVEVRDGAFASPRFIPAIAPGDASVHDKALERGLVGQFHGPAHEEAGGVFIRDGIAGGFAVRREN